MARRTQGEGSITQRQDGRWQASLQVSGKRQTVYGKTRIECQRKLAALVRQSADTGGLSDAGTRTVGDLLTRWIETQTPTCKPSTMAQYAMMTNAHLRPSLGTIRLTKLTPSAIQSLCTALQTEGHYRTAQMAYNILKQALDMAVLWGWLAVNPCSRVMRPQHHAKRKTMWTQAQVRTFLDGTHGHWLYPLWVVALSTGARLGELSGLTWEHVHTDALAIAQGLGRVNGVFTLSSPKTSSSTRTVSLSATAKRALALQRSQQAAWQLATGATWGNALGLAFTNADGTPLHRGTIGRCLARECARLGIPTLTPHGLRHLHASLLLAEGVPIPLVSQRLGHSTPGVTMAVYAHAIGRTDDAATAAIERAVAL